MPITPIYTDYGGGITTRAPQAIICNFIEENWDPAKMPVYQTPKADVFFSHTIMPETSKRIVIHCDVDPSRIQEFELGGRVQFYSQRVVVHAYVSDVDALRESITSDVAEEVAIFLKDLIVDNRETLQIKGIDWIEATGEGWAPNPEDKETQHYYLYVMINYFADITPSPAFNPEVFQGSVFETDSHTET